MKRLLGLLGWLGVVLVLGAVAIRFIRPEWQEWSRGLALAGLAATALYGLSQWRDVARSFQGRNIRYGSMAAGSVVLFVALLVALNYVTNREHKRWDLTAAKQFSLSDQTRKIVGDLAKPLNIKVFYETGHLDEYRDRLSEYRQLSDRVSVEYIDAVRDPVQARALNVEQYGTIVMSYEGRTERTTSTDEQSVTNALKKVIEGAARKVYFVQGHGEHDPTGSDQRGYSGAASALKNDNFEVDKLTLAQEGKVPDDATLVVIAGPKTDYFAPEIDALRAFLKRGGKLLVMLDPPDKADAPPLTNLIALAKDWGFNVGTDLVVDVSGMGRLIGTSEAVPIAMPAPGGHPITDHFQLMTAFPLARSVTPIDGGTDGKIAQRVLETSARSWAETDLKGLFANGQPELNADKGDKEGPISIAAAVSAPAPDAPAPASPDLPKPESRMVVVGDSDFAANGGLNTQGNRDLFQNMANWLAQQENMIAIRPRDPEDRRITLTQDQNERIFWLALVVIPLLLLGNGVRVWWRRR
jgi:gliding motility-associatede transport system auxiliary component